MNPYLEFVQSIETGIRKAKGLAASGKRQSIESGSKVLLFSPHPDDECIVGLLPLRLMRELGHQIINVPVTFGSNIERQAERSAELDDACGYLGWEIFRDMDNLESMEVNDIVRALSTFQPAVRLRKEARLHVGDNLRETKRSARDLRHDRGGRP